MILNVIMIILLYILTLYFIIVVNLIYMMPLEFPRIATDLIFIVGVYGVFILFAYLLYVLFHGVYKKRINKKYMYSYLAFFPIFFIFYFGYYIQYDKGEFIPESTIKTKLQNIEVTDEDNGLIQLGKLYTENKEFTYTIGNLSRKIGNTQRCITMPFKGMKCEKENLEDSLKIYKSESVLKRKIGDEDSKEYLDIDIIENINNNISKVVKYKYFKHNIEEGYISLQGVSSLSIVALFTVIDKLEKGFEDEAIDILLTYKKLGEKFLLGDTLVTGMITGASIESITINNIDYIVSNYNLTDKNLSLLKNSLNTTYNSKEIFANVLKKEYWSNKYSIEKSFKNGEVRGNMFFNKDELYQNMRNILLNNINGNGDYYDNKPKNYFKKEFIYRILSGSSHFKGEWYIKDIEKINTKSKELLEKIKLKLGKNY